MSSDMWFTKKGPPFPVKKKYEAPAIIQAISTSTTFLCPNCRIAITHRVNFRYYIWNAESIEVRSWPASSGYVDFLTDRIHECSIKF